MKSPETRALRWEARKAQRTSHEWKRRLVAGLAGALVGLVVAMWWVYGGSDPATALAVGASIGFVLGAVCGTTVLEWFLLFG